MKTSIEPYTRLFCLQGTRILSDINYYLKFMDTNTLTYGNAETNLVKSTEVARRLMPEHLGHETKGIGWKVIELFHGSKWPTRLREVLVNLAEGKRLVIDMVQKARASKLFHGGKSPETIGGERYFSVDENENVIFVPLKDENTAGNIEQFSKENIDSKIVILNMYAKLEVRGEIALGSGDVILDVLEEVDLGKERGYLLRVKKIKVDKKTGKRYDKIFDNMGITEPASINNRGRKDNLLLPIDLEMLRIIKEFRAKVSGIVFSFVSNMEHMEEIIKALSNVFKPDEIPQVSLKIETLEGVLNLEEIILSAWEKNIKPKIVFGFGDLGAQIREREKKAQGREISDEEVNTYLLIELRKSLEKIKKLDGDLYVRTFGDDFYKPEDHATYQTPVEVAWDLMEGDDKLTDDKLGILAALQAEFGNITGLWVTAASVGAKSDMNKVDNILVTLSKEYDKKKETFLEVCKTILATKYRERSIRQV